MLHFLYLAALLVALPSAVRADCAYIVNETYWPYIPKDRTPFKMVDSVCAEYGYGCCNQFSNTVQSASYGKIDVVFGNANGGCDVCGVNLKRFWCEYACSPNQSNFVQVGDYVTIPNPEKPGSFVTVQNITLWVEGKTACDLFQSCKRTSYAAQVSAMGSPAGFLNFQGQNAIDDGRQTITVKFTNDPTKGLSLKDLDKCGIPLEPGQTLHGFNVTGNCTCNSCSQQCDNSDLIYQPTGVMEGFNWKLVGATWGVVICITLGLTVYRSLKSGGRD